MWILKSASEKNTAVEKTKADTVLQEAEGNNKTNLISFTELFYHIWGARMFGMLEKEEVA